MPLFRLAEQWLDPDGAFAHRLGVGCCTMVLPDALPVHLVEWPIKLPALAAVGTLGADRARLADGGRCLVDADLGPIIVAAKEELGPLWAPIDILLRIVGEVPLAEEGATLAPVRQRHIGADPVGGQPLEVLPRAIG